VHEQVDDGGNEQREDSGDGQEESGADEDGGDTAALGLRRGDAEGHDEGVGEVFKEFHREPMGIVGRLWRGWPETVGAGSTVRR